MTSSKLRYIAKIIMEIKTDKFLGIVAMILFILCMFVLPIIWMIDFSYDTIIEPALMSYKIDCEVLPDLDIQDIDDFDPSDVSYEGWTVAGIYDGSTDQIRVYYPDITTIKHEICHAQQREQNRSKSCDDYYLGINGVLLNEVECYIRQYFMFDVNLSEYGYDVARG